MAVYVIVWAGLKSSVEFRKRRHNQNTQQNIFNLYCSLGLRSPPYRDGALWGCAGPLYRDGALCGCARPSYREGALWGYEGPPHREGALCGHGTSPYI